MLGIHATQVMSLTENIVVEIFVDHIEASSLERQRWLTRVRTAGFDQALTVSYTHLTLPTKA